MRIISPVDTLREVPLLLDAGADELYGGYLPPAWAESFSLLSSPNQRTFAAAQIETREELAAIVRLVHARGRTFALTLNAPFFTEAQQPLVLEYVEQMVDVGIDSLILADLALLRLLRKQYPHLEYHASTLAHLTNAGAVRFFADQGMRRAVLPRHLSVAEMGAIARAVPEMSCDAFFLVGKCPNTEGLCTFHHLSPDRIWPCEIPYTITPRQDHPSPQLQGAIRRQATWSTTNRRHGCGLCALPQLLHAGLDGLKLVGRGAPGAQKARNIQLTREFLDLARREADFESYRTQALIAHRQRFGSACHVNVCYYPEFFPGEDL